MSQQLEQLRDEEESLRQVIRQLSPQQRKEYYRLEGKLIRDPDTYAVLNYLFFGGFHHFYLGKIWRGILNILITLSALVALIVMPPVGIAILVIITIVELFQLFRAQEIVHAHNNQVMRELLQSLNAGFRIRG